MVFFSFNRFAYEIDAFNAQFRLVLSQQKMALRIFDEYGIPVSYSSRIGEYQSPFYVVHYGLIYSDMHRPVTAVNKSLWTPDPTVHLWNLPPKIIEKHYFQNAADWVVRRVVADNHPAHLLYSFDWPYSAHPGGLLKAPWWSGLTDGYAILLLLRAYDVFGDQRYLDAASVLYKSTLTPTVDGGSLGALNSKFWIEEYVDSSADPKLLTGVLNGMVYAVKGVRAYEDFMQIEPRATEVLLKSIFDNGSLFDIGFWSNYDAIGTTANIKYHRINLALMEGVFREYRPTESLPTYLERWRKGGEWPLIFWLFRGQWSIAKLHLLLELVMCGLLGFILVIYRAKPRQGEIWKSSSPSPSTLGRTKS